MTIKSNRWDIKAEPDRERVDSLSELPGVNEVTARLLLNRNLSDIDAAREFLNPSFENMRDPFALKDMGGAIDRIRAAIRGNERICIYGDYDVDGVTSTAILLTYFRRIGYGNAVHYIPERKTEGYGLNLDAVESISKEGVRLLVTVDCGITSLKEVEHANSLGLDVIITDHHTPMKDLPKACAVINPKREDCGFGFRELAGAGIAFKIVQALSDEAEDLSAYAELSALGTVADVVPLVDENRRIVKVGIDALNESGNIGLGHLKIASGLQNKKVDAGNIAFTLAPRINAAGRMGKADTALALLMERDGEKAERIAVRLNEMNIQRQSIEEGILEEAISLIEAQHLTDQNILILGKHGWESGIIGIVASKLVEKYSRPVVMIAMDESGGKASCRSFGSINLYELLALCSGYFTKFGGHRQAAGFSIPKEQISDFKNRLEILAKERISKRDLIPRIGVDCVIDTQKIDFKLIEDIERLEPFGFGNPKPKFVSRNLNLNQFRYVGKNQRHIKASFSEKNRIFDAIGFNMDGYRDLIGRSQDMDIVFNLEKNIFRNVESIQMNLKDMRINEIGYYAISEWGRRYLGVFPRFLFGSGVGNGSVSVKTENISKDLIASLLGNEDVVVAVYTMEGMFRLMGLIEEHMAGHIAFSELLHYGDDMPLGKGSFISVLPDTESLKGLDGKKIVNYDGYGFLEDVECIDASEPSDKALFDDMVRAMIPERKHLVEIYRTLMNSGPFRLFELEGMTDMPFLKLNASLWILKNCNLIDFIGGDYQVEKAPEEKIDIFEDSLFMTLNGYQ